MNAAILLFPGTNRERDMAIALRRATGREPRVVWHRETELPAGLDLAVLPGGFSHGDYLRCGAMAARSPVMPALRRFAERGGHVLGVCNGFQILTEAGMLPGALMRNRDLRFINRWVHTRVESSQSIFTNAYATGAVISNPIAHADGNYFADAETLKKLADEDLVAFRYCRPDGEVSADANPNGSAANIAGLFNKTKTVLGYMPHPERAVDPLTGGTDGRGVFESLLSALS